MKNFKKFLEKIDVLSIHIHLSKNTINFINKGNLKYLKKNILIVNTSRGQIINENDLLNFLKKNKFASYATDVLSDEMNIKKNNKMIKFFKSNKHRILITPHIGGMTKQGQYNAYHGSLENLIKFANK